jgi:hypothetical protein
MLRRFSRTTDPFVAERTAKASLLVPDPAADREQLVRLIEQAMGGSEKANPWFLQSRGLAELRAGRPGPAVKWIEAGRQRYKNAPPAYTALTDLVLSLAYRQQDETDRAREMLGEAARVIDNELPGENVGDLGDGWLDWVFCQVLRREAEALLSEAIPPPEG